MEVGLQKRPKILSIEIGYSTIRICEMEQGDRPKVYRCVEVPTPEHAISDGFLHIGRREVVRDVIMDALKEHKIHTRRVVFSIFSSKIITREIALPPMKASQINAVIEANVAEYFPIDLEDYLITHSLINTETAEEKTGRRKILAIAAEKRLIEQYIKLAQECRLHLVDVDYAGNSVLQAVRKIAGNKQGRMYVKIEPENTLISIMNGDTLVIQRSINYGIGMENMRDWEIKDAVVPIVNTMLRLIDFYAGQAQTNTVECAVIFGEGAEYIEYFKEYEEEVGLTFQALEALPAVRMQNAADMKRVQTFAACIGAAVHSVGFYDDKKDLKEVDYFNASILLIVFFIVCVGAICFVSLMPYHEAKQEEARLQELETLYEEGELVYKEYINVKNLYEQVNYGHELTQHSNDGLIRFLEELEEKMPENIEVTTFSSNDTTVVMNIKIDEKETAAGIIATLREFDSLMSVEVSGVAEKEEESDKKSGKKSKKSEQEETTVEFSITCTYYPIVIEQPKTQTPVS